MSDALAALLAALVGGAAGAFGDWHLRRRRSASEAAAHILLEIVPFVRLELEIGPRDTGRSVDLVSHGYKTRGVHTREVFLHAVDSIERWSSQASSDLEREAAKFVLKIRARHDFIEAYRPVDERGTPTEAILADPRYGYLTDQVVQSLNYIDDRARAIAKRQ